MIARCVRKLDSPAVHLTFDDGPNPGPTDRVLDILAAHGAQATFFVVVEKARREVALLERIRKAGHAIGNHSLDHRYGAFFSSDATLKEWIRRAQDELTDLWGGTPVAFRSPAGIRTPPLGRALRELGIPLVHWNVRFFDTVIPWTVAKAEKSAKTIAPGSIVLLHDVHEGSRGKIFERALDCYLDTLARRAIPLAPIEAKALQATAP